MSSKDSHLYGIRNPKSKKTHEISSSTTLSFTSTLSSLLSTSNKTPSTTGRSRPSTNKSDIFTSHNKNTKKRALKDISSDLDGISTSQIHSKTSEDVDDSILHRSKRKMEEKARLYAAMKRGDYVPREGERGEKDGGLIDFDRKWAEMGTRGEKGYGTESDSGLDSDSSSEERKGAKGKKGGRSGQREEEQVEMVEYTDEFGRVRQLPKSEATKLEKKKLRAEAASLELEELRARPITSSNLIYGDVIQTGAFNPDAETSRKMEELASKRDKEETPPPETHYEADKEVRSKGVGFFSFSKDEGERKREMEALEEERKETERKRREREEKKRVKMMEVEERRKVLVEKRARKEADRFLEGLGLEMGEDGS